MIPENYLVMHAVERLAVVASGTAFGFLGFQLYKLGFTKGPGKITGQVSKLVRFAASGTGPGIVFMGFGALVLMVALATGKIESDVRNSASDVDPLTRQDVSSFVEKYSADGSLPESLRKDLLKLKGGLKRLGGVEEERWKISNLPRKETLGDCKEDGKGGVECPA